MSGELVSQVLIGLFSAGAVYGGIRSDLRAMHEKISSTQKAVEAAHMRLDNHIDRK